MRGIAGVLCAGLLFAAEVEAEPTWAQRCQIPASADGVTVVKVDANSGQLIEGSLTVESGARLRVDFLGKNPFKYVYRLGTTAQLSDSEAVAEYLKRLPGLAAPVGAEAEGPRRERAGFDGTRCEQEPEKAWLQGISNRLKALQEREKKLGDELTEARAFTSLYETFLDKTDSAAFATSESCLRSTEAAGQFLQAKVPTLQPGIASFPDDVAALERDLKSPPNQDAADCAAANFGEAFEKLLKAKDEPSKVIDGLGVATKAQGAVRDILQDPEAFHSSRFPVITDEATVVHVRIFRRNLRQETSTEQPVAEFEIEAGRGRVSITAGALISFLPFRRVVRQQGRAEADGPVTTLFAYAEDSDFLIAPAVLLNVRFIDISSIDSAVHATFGVLGTRDAVEVVAGPSFSFAGDRVFVTLGAHAARREELSGGFAVGQPIPEALTDPLPLKMGWKVGFAGGLTFRL